MISYGTAFLFVEWSGMVVQYTIKLDANGNICHPVRVREEFNRNTLAIISSAIGLVEPDIKNEELCLRKHNIVTFCRI